MSIHGYEKYRPSPRAASVLRASFTILSQYEAWESPMTVRQVFYRLIAEYSYPKTEADYKSLVGWIARSRRARQGFWLECVMGKEMSGEEANEAAFEDQTLIPFSWIRDEKGQSIEPSTFDDRDDFLDTARGWAEDLNVDRQEGQEQVLEIWCEANGMVPLMREIGAPYTLRVSSGGGYDSVTAKHDLAQRVIQRIHKRNLPTVVLHVGDFDPSGEGMYETLRDDVGAMVHDFGAGSKWFKIERVALTEQQVIDLQVETAPPKPKDARRRGFVERHPEIAHILGTEDITAQLEAMTPPELKALIEEQITSFIDDEAYEAVLEQEQLIRDETTDFLDDRG